MEFQCFLNHYVLTNLKHLKRLIWSLYLLLILNPLLVFRSYYKTSLIFLVSMSLFKLLFGMTINTFLFRHFTRTFSNSKTEYFVNLTRHLFQHRWLNNYKYYRKTSRLLGCKNRLLQLRSGIWMQRTKPR